MRTKKLSVFAALVCGFALTLTSCDEKDNPVDGVTTATISFENQQLNADGFWIGEAKGNSYSYEDDWGGKTTTFTDNAYEEATVKFPVTYSLYESAYGTSNFAVITTYGETIDLGEGVVIKKLFYTNSAYTVNSILNGDNYSGAKFDATDWFKCTLIATKADGTTANVDIDLAKDGTYVSQWQLLDLSSLGKITSLGFAFTGSRSNDYGVLTPAYICLDDITVEY